MDRLLGPGDHSRVHYCLATSARARLLTDRQDGPFLHPKESPEGQSKPGSRKACTWRRQFGAARRKAAEPAPAPNVPRGCPRSAACGRYAPASLRNPLLGDRPGCRRSGMRSQCDARIGGSGCESMFSLAPPPGRSPRRGGTRCCRVSGTPEGDKRHQYCRRRNFLLPPT
jgi:hypothetical protein